MWSEIRARVRACYAGLLDRVSRRGVEGLAPGDSRWAQILAGVTA